MSRTHIVIGRTSRNAPPKVVYCGEDGAAALAAQASSPLEFTEYFRNPRGIRKQILAHAANAAAVEAKAAAPKKAASATPPLPDCDPGIS